jgi:hypothetical protein
VYFTRLRLRSKAKIFGDVLCFRDVWHVPPGNNSGCMDSAYNGVWTTKKSIIMQLIDGRIVALK